MTKEKELKEKLNVLLPRTKAGNNMLKAIIRYVRGQETRKQIEVFKEFQREMLKKRINVKIVFEISNKVKETCDIKIPKSNKTFKQIIDEAKKKPNMTAKDIRELGKSW